MSEVAIRVDNLGKAYRIGLAPKKTNNSWEAVKRLVSMPFDYLQRMMRPPTEEETIWAIKNISFEVERGEVVGIIGRNGAGKSTLLKILSRITEPTEGRALIHGRVGSLLEVGTGFHPELTGRENIYLNGAILGMTRAEINHKFDEIVDFSGVIKSIDTPVKRYSSGMYVRLAFSVAAHLEPEILLVDEVLAVGDVAFQKKCLGKMRNVAGEGRTILFVSHNMAAIQSLCSRVILLQDGRVVKSGPSEVVVTDYLRSQLHTDFNVASIENEHFKLLNVEISGENGDVLAPFQPMRVVLRVQSKRAYEDIAAHVLFEDELGQRILGLDSHDFVTGVNSKEGQEFKVVFDIKELPLSPGPFNIHIWVKSHTNSVFKEMGMVPFEVANLEVYGTRVLERRWHGLTVAHVKVNIETL